MSMYPQARGSIPQETIRVAHAACPKGTLAMRLRDGLGERYQDEYFTALSPVEGQPAYLDKTHLPHVLTTVAINLVRIDAVVTQTPRGKTRLQWSKVPDFFLQTDQYD